MKMCIKRKKCFFFNKRLIVFTAFFLFSILLRSISIIDSLFTELKTSKQKSDIYLQIGYEYYQEGKLNKYKKYMKMAQTLSLKEKNYIAYIKSLFNISSDSLNDKNYKRVIANFKKSYNYISSDSSSIAYYRILLGKLYQNSSHSVEALKLYLLSKKYYDYHKMYNDRYYFVITNIENIYSQENRYKKAVSLLLNSIEIAKSKKQWQHVYKLSLSLANEYLSMRLNYKALNIFYNILSDSKYKLSEINKANIYRSIGIILRNNNPIMAQNYFEKSLKIYKQNNNLFNMFTPYNSLANIYSDKKDYETSLKYYEKALDIAIKFDDKYEEAIIYNNMGEIDREKKNYDEAMKYYEKSLKLYDKNFQDDNLPATIFFNFATIYYEKENYKKAFENLRKINSLNKEQISEELWKGIYKLYSKIYEKLGSYKKSLIYLKKYLKIEKKLNSKSQRENINRLQLKIETLQIENKIKSLTKDKKIQELQIQKERYKNKYYAIIGIFLLLGIIFLSYAVYAVKKTHKETKLLNKKLDTLSRKDPLTKLSNRRDILEKIEYEMIRCQRNDIPLSFILGDIDYFKKINDNYGHDAGDFVLKKLARIFQTTLRKQDMVARWGGEEFLIVLPDTNRSNAYNVAEKLRKKIEETTFKYNDVTIRFTITFGVSQLESDIKADQIIKRADMALYIGKERGRNCSVQLI